jgi:hypothetical protein
MVAPPHGLAGDDGLWYSNVFSGGDAQRMPQEVDGVSADA